MMTALSEQEPNKFGSDKWGVQRRLKSRLPTNIWVRPLPSVVVTFSSVCLASSSGASKPRGPLWFSPAPSHFQPREEWKMKPEKASWNTLSHMKSGSERTWAKLRKMCWQVWHLYFPSKYQLLILGPNGGKFPSLRRQTTDTRGEVGRREVEGGTG